MTKIPARRAFSAACAWTTPSCIQIPRTPMRIAASIISCERTRNGGKYPRCPHARECLRGAHNSSRQTLPARSQIYRNDGIARGPQIVGDPRNLAEGGYPKRPTTAMMVLLAFRISLTGSRSPGRTCHPSTLCDCIRRCGFAAAWISPRARRELVVFIRCSHRDANGVGETHPAHRTDNCYRASKVLRREIRCHIPVRQEESSRTTGRSGCRDPSGPTKAATSPRDLRRLTAERGAASSRAASAAAQGHAGRIERAADLVHLRQKVRLPDAVADAKPGEAIHLRKRAQHDQIAKTRRTMSTARE